MPVRSSRSSVFKWPDANEVHAAVVRWATDLVAGKPEVERVGYIGSYARGDWGVGSDVDIIVIVQESDSSYLERGVDFEAAGLPVPADVLVYTEDEWRALRDRSARLYDVACTEGVWVYP